MEKKCTGVRFPLRQSRNVLLTRFAIWNHLKRRRCLIREEIYNTSMKTRKLSHILEQVKENERWAFKRPSEHQVFLTEAPSRRGEKAEIKMPRWGKLRIANLTANFRIMKETWREKARERRAWSNIFIHNGIKLFLLRSGKLCNIFVFFFLPYIYIFIKKVH